MLGGRARHGGVLGRSSRRGTRTWSSAAAILLETEQQIRWPECARHWGDEDAVDTGSHWCRSEGEQSGARTGYFFARRLGRAWAVRLSASLAAAGLGLVDDERVGPLWLQLQLCEGRWEELRTESKGQCLGTMQGGQLSVTETAHKCWRRPTWSLRVLGGAAICST